MKRIVVLMSMLMVCVSVFSQKLQFETQTFDFSTIQEEKGVVACTFNFVNKSKNAYIDVVKTGQNYIRASYQRDVMAKKAKGSIQIDYDPKGRSGAFSDTIRVKTVEKGKDYIYQLVLKGKVEPRQRTIQEIYSMKEGNVRYIRNQKTYNNLTPTKVVKDTFHFFNESTSEMTFVKNNLPPAVKIIYLTPKLAPMTAGILVFEYDASKKNDWGPVWDKIVITTTDTDRPNKTFYITGRILDDFDSWTPKQRQNAPKIKFSTEEYQFGTVTEGTDVEHVFVISNEGKSTLYLRKLKQSCSCTLVKPEKMELEPGESTNVKAIFKTSNKKGKQLRTIDVICNDPERPSTTLKITGVVNPKEK